MTAENSKPLTDAELADLMKAESEKLPDSRESNGPANLDRAMQSDPDIGRQPAHKRVWAAVKRWTF